MTAACSGLRAFTPNGHPQALSSSSAGLRYSGGYPGYSQAGVDSAVTAYLVYLSVVGALGVACWLWTIWAFNKSKQWPGRPRP